VSEITVKQALERLVNQKVLTRLQGRGTSVAKLSDCRRLTQLLCFKEEVMRKKLVPERHLLGTQEAAATPNISRVAQAYVNLESGARASEYREAC